MSTQSPNKDANLPSSFHLDQSVQVIFPDNGKLQGKISKVSFTSHGKVLYDVEIPFSAGGDPEVHGYFRLHGIDSWFIGYAKEDWIKMRLKDKEYPEMETLALVEEMCTQSLPPDLYDKWVEVLGMLYSTRKALKSTIPNTENSKDELTEEHLTKEEKADLLHALRMSEKEANDPSWFPNQKRADYPAKERFLATLHKFMQQLRAEIEEAEPVS